ncbi:unnamed protein product [Calypogeia fissa]
MRWRSEDAVAVREIIQTSVSCCCGTPDFSRGLRKRTRWRRRTLWNGPTHTFPAPARPRARITRRFSFRSILWSFARFTCELSLKPGKAEISESGSTTRTMSADVNQKKWIWEFFLKNCKDEQMIQELMTTLPFPRENLDLRRLHMLRALSLQSSKGTIDERTLDILEGLGELGRAPATKKKRLPANFSCQEVAKRPKVSEYESKDDEATNSSSTPQVQDGGGGGVPLRNSEQRRGFSKDPCPAETIVGYRDSIIGRPMSAQTVGGIRDWMKGRALPRSLGGGGDPALKTLSKGNTEMGCADNAGLPDGSEDLPGNQFFSPDQSRKHCELELALMLELAVKHLRADSRDRKKFEAAVTKHWGDSSDDSDAWHGAGIPGMARAREQIKIELWMVLRNQELLDGLVEKYTKARVADLLKIYLEKEWAATGRTFLERVSADVMLGKYKPVNCNGQRSKKAGSPRDGDAGQQSSGMRDTSEKRWIRASRGQYSRSREKLQKSLAIWDLDDGDEAGGAIAKVTIDERARDGEDERAEDGGSRQPDLDHGDKDGANLKIKTSEGCEIGPSLSTQGGFEPQVRSLRFDGSVARVLEFEDPSGRGDSEDGQQQCQEKENIGRPDKEATDAEHLLHQTHAVRNVSGGGGDVDVTGGSPVLCAPDMAKVPGDSNVIDLSEHKETSTTSDEKLMKSKATGDSYIIDLSKENETSTIDDEKRAKEGGSPKNTDLQAAEPESPHDVVNKENCVPQSPSKPTDSNPTVCFSPPPWVEGSPAVPGGEVSAPPGARRKRRHVSIQEETDTAIRREGCSSAEVAAPRTCSDQSPDTVSTQRNLTRKQRALDAAVQDPLPKILTTSRCKGSLLERNATARTVEWEDDNDIEDSPSSSPSASRHVRLPHPTTGRKISPLVGSKTSGTTNAKNGRRKPRRWSDKEVEILKREVGKYGKGRWKLILAKNLDTFHGRTEVDLKDKWRNLERFEGLKD